MSTANIEPDSSHQRFKDILKYSNLIKGCEIDKYNKKVLRFGKKSYLE